MVGSNSGVSMSSHRLAPILLLTMTELQTSVQGPSSESSLNRVVQSGESSSVTTNASRSVVVTAKH